MTKDAARVLIALLIELAAPGFVRGQYEGLLINEFLANPRSGTNFHVDANGDGVNNVFDDEFVELLNTSTNPIDASGLILYNAALTIKQHVFHPRIVPPGGSLVVFGGGSLLSFSNPPAQLATSGSLGLNNDADTILLYSPQTTLVHAVSYANAPPAASFTRQPEGGSNVVNHLVATTNSARASPGRRASGQPYLARQPPVLLEVGDHVAFAGETMFFPVRAFDSADGDAISLSAFDMPLHAEMASTGGWGTVSFSPTMAQAGQSYVVTFSASDVDGSETNTSTLRVVAPVADEAAWINELHYDNTATDENEGIEIAGTANTALTNYTLVLYNGVNGQAYNTRILSGTIDDEQCGMGAVWFDYPVNGIQNDVDGVALMRGTQVLQFVSYEGAITAANGPAAGLDAQQLPVDEDPPPPVGQSLQLSGTGSAYAAFSWAGPIAHSRGSLNTNQTISCASPPAIVLQKSVYLGHDGGASIPGLSSVQGTNGAAITYGFLVTNTGGSALTNVTVEDITLGLPLIEMGDLSPGQTLTARVETVIFGDLRNTARASGYDPTGLRVESADSADVVEIIPLLELRKTVYRGHDAGAGCPGGERVADTNGAPITFCFRITNAGNTNLTSVTLFDSSLGLDPVPLGTLQPGSVISTAVTSWVAGDTTNIATVSGQDPNGATVLDTDEATVDELHPALTFRYTVYAGHDGGGACPGASSAHGTNGAPLTLCYTVSNRGDVAFANVDLEDPLWQGLVTTNLGALAVGQQRSFSFPVLLSGNLTNTALAHATTADGLMLSTQSIVILSVDMPLTDCGAWQIVDLGTLGGTTSYAFALNEIGQIVGQSQNAIDQFQAFIWQDGVMQPLLNLPGISNSAALDINNAGWVTGEALLTNGQGRAFLFSNAQMSVVATLPGGTFNRGTAINEAGQICGISGITNVFGMPGHPFAWTGQHVIDLDTFHWSYDGEAYDMDDAGHVVGRAHYWCPSFCWEPFLWSDENTNNARDFSEMKHLGTFGGFAGEARAINALGLVAGWSYQIEWAQKTAFLVTPQNGRWDDDDDMYTRTNSYMQSLGTLGGMNSEAFGINDSGEVVGSSDTTSGIRHAFFWAGGMMTDLNTLICPISGWTLNEARDINNQGQVVGIGTLAGQTRAFLLRPASIAMTGIASPNGTHLSWTSRNANLYYTVELSTSLLRNSWSPAPSIGPWPIQTMTWSTTQSYSHAFYRIRAVTNP